MNHISFHLKEIFFQKKTGKLTFKRKDITRYFFFQDGEIFQIKTNVQEERLGDVLFKLQRIRQDEHSRIEDLIEPNRSLGEVLKNKGVISEHDLDEAVIYQIREAVLNCFPYFDAEISFVEHPGFKEKPEPAKVSVPFLIEFGIRRLPSAEPFRSFICSGVPAMKTEAYVYLLTEEEKKILALINGLDPAPEILKKAGTSDDFFWRSLFLFYCLDIIELPGETAWPAQPAAADERPGAAGEPAIDEVLSFRESLAGKNFYQVLGLSRTASPDEIKKSYFRMARKFHPDRFSRGLPKEKKALIEEVFSAVTNAYRTLGNPERRREYDQKGTAEPLAAEAPDFARMAETKFRQGKTLYNQNRFVEAMTFLAEAVRLKKDKGDYFLLLALAESRIPGYTRKAEEDFLKASALEPWNPEAYVGLGLLYEKEGLKVKATNQFKRALEADSDHAVARQHYQDLSGKKAKSLKGLFSFSLFGQGKKKK